MIPALGHLRSWLASHRQRCLGQGKPRRYTLRGWARTDANLDCSAIQGAPWDTTIIIRWTATDTFPDGKPYNNHGVHIIKMTWFKVYEIDANEDSQVVDRMMKGQAEAGVKEAAMPPITS